MMVKKWALQVGMETEGYATPLGAVTKELGLTYTLGTQSGHIVEAKAMRYAAFQRHAKARYRSPTTKSLKPIPSTTWSWLGAT